ncbi:hypothetical protein CMV_015762 [Castanea mollissima]|uniref:Uncharacterized protein n=1 Tax=Castanea mollissima TaxID=60419 RepID=A0A8J4R0Y0_9ROSI|nr:hypothetical protein CMV_015762 [Castanea mollissima]
MLVQENGAKRPAPVRDMSALAAAAPELDLKTPCKIYEILGTPENHTLLEELLHHVWLLTDRDDKDFAVLCFCMVGNCYR